MSTSLYELQIYGTGGEEGHLTNAIVLNRDNYREMDDNERSRE